MYLLRPQIRNCREWYVVETLLQCYDDSGVKVDLTDDEQKSKGESYCRKHCNNRFR